VISSLAHKRKVANLAIERLISELMREPFVIFGRTIALARVHEKMARISLPPNWSAVPSAIHDLKHAVGSLQRFSIPFGRCAAVRLLWHPPCLCHIAGSNEAPRRAYGKDNRVLHTAKFSQGFKVVATGRTWQSIGISTTGTTIRVTGSEARRVEAEIEQDEATIRSNQETCG
jgi:hypothetical protein